MKFLSIFLFFITFSSFSQFNSKAPWMEELHQKSTKKTFTLQEISDAFNNYWDKHQDQINEKGNGYKPFKRWENRWSLSLNNKGEVISNKTLWNAWEKKNKLSRNSLNGISDWQELGPFTQESKSGQGRVNTFAVDPNNSNIYYVGAPAGGIWKSTDTGLTWTPLADHLPQIGVSGITIDPNNSNIIYIATGDDDANDSYSIGVLKSIDGGNTWNTTGLQFINSGKESNEIYINPLDSNMLWVATSDGVYKTTDAGDNWNLTLSEYIRDLKLKPGNPNIIYAVSSSNFYKSIDAGDHFTLINSGLPSYSNRLAIEVTPANGNLVYVLSAGSNNSFQGLYKSINSGNSFTQTAETNNIFGGSTQSWYDMALTVSDTDENIVFVGVLDIWKSTNGGNHFSQINQWYDSASPTFTHADIHFLRYFNGQLFCGSDGGIYKSTDDGNSFNELNEGLAISMLYRIANAKQSENNITGGLQDNGGFAFSNNTWYNYHGGDGMDCAVDPNNPNTYYGFSQYGGSLNVTYNGGISGQGVTGSPEQGNWVTPMQFNSEGDLYAGFSKLYQLINSQWQQISGDDFGGNINRIEIDPNNSDIIFVARYSELYKSTNKGLSFTYIYSANNNISSVEINNDNGNMVYLTTSSGEDGQVLKSTDGGNNFTNITGNLPYESKLIIKHQPHSPQNDLFVGSSLGVYHINDGMTDWETYSQNLPNVPVRDLEININDAKIIAGTYGRSVWSSPIEVVAPTNDVRLVAISNPNLSVSCNNTIIPLLEVKNNGQNSINQVQIDYSIDNNNYNFVYNGLINSQQTVSIALPETITLTLGEHTLQVTTSITNDAYNDNNSSNTSFYINQSDSHPTVLNPFTNSNNQWLIVGNQNVWQIGMPTTSLLISFSNTGYATNLHSNYPDNASSYLVSPCYDLTTITNPILKFNMAFDLEQDYDVLYVEYSSDQGQSWEVLGTANDTNWYNSSFDANQLTIGKQWTGTDATLKEYSHDLSMLTNENTIIFRFSFLSDQGVNNEGVFIDDFIIEGQVASTNQESLKTVQIFPNPSKGAFTISRNNTKPLNISVYDISGKQVYSESQVTSSNHQINLNVSQGIYFVKLKSDNSSLVKKLIVR